MCSAKEELSKVKPADPNEKAALKRAETKLSEGTKALAERQKHIKVADRSEFGWATVHYYQDDPLASDSEDEKSLNRAEKEVRKDAERVANKRHQGGGNASASKRRRTQYQWSDAGPGSSLGGGKDVYTPAPPAAMPQRQKVPQELGPCWRCRRLGHIAVNCTTQFRPYPFFQPGVSSAEASQPAVESAVAVSVKCVDSVSAEQVTPQGGVDKVEICKSKVLHVSVDTPHTASDLGENSGLDSTEAFTKYWEVENTERSQVTDVQGRLRKKFLFWKEVLHAPPPILECIENGYRLPLKFIPPNILSAKSSICKNPLHVCGRINPKLGAEPLCTESGQKAPHI